MMTKPMVVGTPTFRDYEDYKYGKAWADGWNAAMKFIFAKELESERAKQLRANFRLVTGNEEQNMIKEME